TPQRTLLQPRRSVATVRSLQAPDRGAGPRRCLRFARPVAARRAVGGARLLRCAAAAARRPRPAMRSRADCPLALAHPGRTGGRRLRRDLDVVAFSSAEAAALAIVGTRRGAY